MIRINNIGPLILVLLLLIILIVSKYTKIAIIISIVGLMILLLNFFNIIHYNQLIVFFNKVIDLFLINDNPLELNNKIESFKDTLMKENKFDTKDIPKDVVYDKIPILAQYETLHQRIKKFINSLNESSDILDKTAIINNINKNIGYIYYYSYLVINNEYLPQKNYTNSLEYQKKLLNDIHNFIYLDVNPLQDTEMNSILDETQKINKKLNTFLINTINTKNELTNENKNIHKYSGILPSLNEPEPYDSNEDIDNYF